MTPNLVGRIQTRILLLSTIGLLWTFLIVPFLPKGGASIPETYAVTVLALIMVAVLGFGWEIIYHLIQQYRWEKDWPTIFGLLVAIPEGVLAWFLLRHGIPWSVGEVPASTFLSMFISLWLLVWAIANGPLQIFFLRWRYRGGRFTGDW